MAARVGLGGGMPVTQSIPDQHRYLRGWRDVPLTRMKKKPETANDWLSVLAAAGKQTADEVPPGFKTINQIVKETGKSHSQTNRYVREALKLGLIERLKLKVPVGEKLYPTPHYRILCAKK